MESRHKNVCVRKSSAIWRQKDATLASHPALLSNSTTVACFCHFPAMFSHGSLIIRRTVSLASFSCQFLCNLKSDYRYLRQILVGGVQIGCRLLANPLGIIIRVLLHFLLIHGDHKLDSNLSCVTNTNKLRVFVINFHAFARALLEYVANALSIHLVFPSR